MFGDCCAATHSIQVDLIRCREPCFPYCALCILCQLAKRRRTGPLFPPMLSPCPDNEPDDRS